MADLEKRVKSGSRIGSGFPPIEQFELGRPGQPGYFKVRSGNVVDDVVILSGVDGLYRIWAGRESAALAPFSVTKDGKITAKRLVLDNYINCVDPSIEYIGAWVINIAGDFKGGKQAYTQSAGSKFVITYHGPDISVFMERASDRGPIKVTLDGNVILPSHDLYSSYYRVRGVAFSLLGGSNTDHILEVEALNSGPTEAVGFMGYSLYPNAGINLEQLDCELIVYGGTIATNANGYISFTNPIITDPDGNLVYSVYAITGVALSPTQMADAIDDPKICWRNRTIYLYNGQPSTTYSVVITVLVSRLG